MSEQAPPLILIPMLPWPSLTGAYPLLEEEMTMEMLSFPGEFSAIPLNSSGTWHPTHFKRNPKLFIKNQLMLEARDMAMNMSGITSYDRGMRSPQSNLREMFAGKNESMLRVTLKRG